MTAPLTLSLTVTLNHTLSPSLPLSLTGLFASVGGAVRLSEAFLKKVAKLWNTDPETKEANFLEFSF